MIHIKICGLQPGDDLSFTRYREITHVGFILVPASRRYVGPAEISVMAREVDASCKKVGVYVNDAPATVIDSAKMAGLDVVQLHGNEDLQSCRQLKRAGFQVWKALSMPVAKYGAETLAAQMVEYAPFVDAVLLDAAPPKGAQTSVTGGHGVQFDWARLRAVEDLLQKQSGGVPLPPVWVAGGIRPDNVSSLLQEFTPYGIDVSSGVEVNQRKSIHQIEAMREAVKRHVDRATTG